MSRASNIPVSKTTTGTGQTMGSPVTGGSSTGGQAGKQTSGGQSGYHLVPHEKVAMRAYEKWFQRGCPAGTEQQDWHEAESELRAEMSQTGKQGR